MTHFSCLARSWKKYLPAKMTGIGVKCVEVVGLRTQPLAQLTLNGTQNLLLANMSLVRSFAKTRSYFVMNSLASVDSYLEMWQTSLHVYTEPSLDRILVRLHGWGGVSYKHAKIRCKLQGLAYHTTFVCCSWTQVFTVSMIDCLKVSRIINIAEIVALGI
jgi:hypothetical protein